MIIATSLFVSNIITFFCLVYVFCQNEKIKIDLKNKQEEINCFKSKLKTICCYIPKDLEQFYLHKKLYKEWEENDTKEKIIHFLINDKENLKKAISIKDTDKNYKVAEFTYLQGGINGI